MSGRTVSTESWLTFSDLQDQVTSRVVGAIAPKLEQAEIERAKRKPTEGSDAYDYFLRGMAAFYQFTKPGNEEALMLFSGAIEGWPTGRKANSAKFGNDQSKTRSISTALGVLDQPQLHHPRRRVRRPRLFKVRKVDATGRLALLDRASARQRQS